MIRRNTKIAGALLALIFLGLWRHLGSLKDTPPTAFAREVKLDFTNEQVWVFEENIHDGARSTVHIRKRPLTQHRGQRRHRCFIAGCQCDTNFCLSLDSTSHNPVLS